MGRSASVVTIVGIFPGAAGTIASTRTRVGSAGSSSSGRLSRRAASPGRSKLVADHEDVAGDVGGDAEGLVVEVARGPAGGAQRSRRPARC